MKPGTVRAHENGQNGISLADLEHYSRRYGVTMDWLISGRGRMEPDEKVNVSGLLNMHFIMAQLRDDVWLTHQEGDDPDEWPGWGIITTPAGVDEEVDFYDSRFPEEMITAMKVRTDLTDGPYIDGSIVFAVEAAATGFKDGDHVVTIREKGQFCEWSLRRVAFKGDATALESLISRAPDYEWKYDEPMPDDIHVLGTVIASLTRRPVPPLTPQQRKTFEDDQATARKLGKK